MGIALPAALAAIEKLNRNSHSAARTFVNLFLEELWKPFDEAGRPDEGWPEIIQSIERLRPLAVDALVATFRLTLTEEVEKAFGEVLERRKQEEVAGRAAQVASSGNLIDSSVPRSRALRSSKRLAMAPIISRPSCRLAGFGSMLGWIPLPRSRTTASSSPPCRISSTSSGRSVASAG